MEFHNVLRQKRLKAGVKATTVAREMLLTKSQYSAIETGRVTIPLEEQQDFLDDVEDILAYYQEWWIDRDGLEWRRVTPEILDLAMQELERGRNIVQIGIKYGVNDLELEKKLCNSN